MIEHVYRRAADARGVDAVIVATDDDRIRAAVERFGGVARMTKSSHPTGTDRIAEVAAELSCEVVVNVQGDEPLIEPGMIEDVLAPFASDATVDMATVRRAITDPADAANPNVVKVVSDQGGHALYFSRAPIPFCLQADGHGAPVVGAVFSRPAYRHIGLYAYRRSFVLTLARLAPTPLEIAESLEQLRALEHGFRIRVVETRFDSIGVDTPEDLERVRRRLAPHQAHRSGVGRDWPATART
jgi:3-deoxy-manno-octulosonate cytidylyltransferase (CMP-KDO synthetase)